jgi:hypothetical protein
VAKVTNANVINTFTARMISSLRNVAPLKTAILVCVRQNCRGDRHFAT